MRDGGAFCHEALLYRGAHDLLERSVEFVREGIEADEAVLVVLDEQKNDALRTALGSHRDAVAFADMNVVGENPARIIPVWQDFIDAHPGRTLRGIGEPVTTTRHGAELTECHRHEALINLAFDGAPFWLLCPYDVATLDPTIVDEVSRTHPVLRYDDDVIASNAYRALDTMHPLARVLPEPSRPLIETRFDTLTAVRDTVTEFAVAAGMHRDRLSDLVIAVNEVATNSLIHGGGFGWLRMWREAPWLVCEVSDEGLIDEPLAGRRCPPAESEGGRGLWMVNQLCDLVQLASSAAGTAVRIHMRI